MKANGIGDTLSDRDAAEAAIPAAVEDQGRLPARRSFLRRHVFRIRTMMLLVALAALATWGTIMVERSKVYAAKARRHEVNENWHKSNLSMDYLNIREPYIWKWGDTLKDREELSRRIAEDLQPRIASLTRMLEFESGLGRKYRRAARYPWMGVEADPPAPPQWMPPPPLGYNRAAGR